MSNKIKPTQDNTLTPNLNTRRTRVTYHIISFLCIIVFISSWILNFGWFRLFLGLPMLIHTIIFRFSNSYYCKYNYANKKIRFVNYLVYATYLLFYILLPDFADDTGTTFAVFGLFKNSSLVDIMWEVSGYLFVLNIILIIWQIVYTIKERRKMKR